MMQDKAKPSRFAITVRGAALSIAALLTTVGMPASAQDAPAGEKDPLATFACPPEAPCGPLPKIAAWLSPAPALAAVTARSVVRRDLELSGEFDVIPDSDAPEGAAFAETVDIAAWRKKGAEALVKVIGRKSADGKAELKAIAYLLDVGADPVFEKRFEVPLDRVRAESHYVADQVIGALTGTQGGFYSHLTFVSGIGSLRRVYRIDSDGFDAKPISPSNHVAIAPAYGPNGELYWAGSVNKEEYKASAPDKPIVPNVRGSVYGLAFNKDYSQVAVSIGVRDTIKLFSGPSLTELKEASTIGTALRPGFTPSGKIAFSGAGKFGQRIYVGDKPISPDGLFASAPTFCRHPDGIRAVFAVGVGKDTDLVLTGENGGQLVRLTQNAGSNGYPACSPDGRMIAFMSTRTTGEGPGIYIMRLGGGAKPKRISTLTGDSLRWDRLPPSKSVEKK